MRSGSKIMDKLTHPYFSSIYVYSVQVFNGDDLLRQTISKSMIILINFQCKYKHYLICTCKIIIDKYNHIDNTD